MFSLLSTFGFNLLYLSLIFLNDFSVPNCLYLLAIINNPPIGITQNGEILLPIISKYDKSKAIVIMEIHIRSKYDTNITALIISDGVIPKSRRRRLKKRMNMYSISVIPTQILNLFRSQLMLVRPAMLITTLPSRDFAIFILYYNGCLCPKPF